MPSISKTDAAFMAGIMDGEGHFSISCGGYYTPYFDKVRQVTRPPYRNYGLRIGCANTHKRLINWVLEHIGGTYVVHRHKSADWKICYKWQLYGAKAQEEFILCLLPYLVLKREQANILLQFIRLDGVENPSKREELYRKVLLLNRRGASPTTNTPNTSKEVKIESGLHGDVQSVPQVTAVS